MLNSAIRQSWRRQQEERENKELFFFLFFSWLSCVNGDQQVLATIIPAATCSHGSGKQLGAYFFFTLFSSMFLQQPASLQISQFSSCRGKTPLLSFQGKEVQPCLACSKSYSSSLNIRGREQGVRVGGLWFISQIGKDDVHYIKDFGHILLTAEYVKIFYTMCQALCQVIMYINIFLNEQYRVDTLFILIMHIGK